MSKNDKGLRREGQHLKEMCEESLQRVVSGWFVLPGAVVEGNTIV